MGEITHQPKVGYPKIVQEFYANALQIENDGLDKYKSMVRGVQINFSSEKINEFCGINSSKY